MSRGFGELHFPPWRFGTRLFARNSISSQISFLGTKKVTRGEQEFYYTQHLNKGLRKRNYVRATPAYSTAHTLLQ